MKIPNYKGVPRRNIAAINSLIRHEKYATALILSKSYQNKAFTQKVQQKVDKFMGK